MKYNISVFRTSLQRISTGKLPKNWCISIDAVHLDDFSWWFWFMNLLFTTTAIIGWEPGYYMVMEISLLNLINCVQTEKRLLSFPGQVRMIYFGLSLFGLWVEVRLIIYLVLAVLLFANTFLERCAISFILKQLPGNLNQEVKKN